MCKKKPKMQFVNNDFSNVPKILSFDNVRYLIFLILVFFLEPRLNMVLSFKIKISSMKHGRYIFYSNEAM